MSKTIGIFLSDLHMPEETNLIPVLKYTKDLYKEAQDQKVKFLIVLGGDIIDAKGMHGIESLQASQIKLEWYERDKKLLSSLLQRLLDIAPKADLVYLEGNHEERYGRIMFRYPDAWGGRFNFHRDVVVKYFPKAKWVPYGNYDAWYQLGDLVFKHGTIYPENHARKYAEIGARAGVKTVYGHLHGYQAWTVHSDMPKIQPSLYALTSGCLTSVEPVWKKGAPNMWINGFVDFVSENGVTIPTSHIIEKGRFYVAGKEYK